MVDQVRIGVLGAAGEAAEGHIRGFQSTARAVVTTVADVNRAKLQQRAQLLGIENVAASVEELVNANNVDAVVVATPDHLHAKHASMALAAGKHVLCEKPTSTTRADAARLVELVRAHDRVFLGGHIYHFRPDYRLLAEAYRRGDIGTAWLVEGDYVSNLTSMYGATGRTPWRSDPIHPQDIMLGGGCHPLGLMRWVLQEEVVEVSAYSNHLAEPRLPLDDCYVAILKFSGGAIGRLTAAAGIHVLSEVPAAVSITQAEELVGAVRQSSAIYRMAENYCYIRSNMIVREMARAGLFGDIYYAEGEYLHDVRDLQQTATGERTWRSYWQTGRNGFTYPTHSLGPLLQWTDDRIVSVSCVGSGHNAKPHFEVEDTTVLLARTRKGALLRARLDMLSPRPHLMDYYSLQGTSGAYEAGRASGDTPRVYVTGRSAEGAWDSLDTYEAEFLPGRYHQPPAADAGHWGSDAWPILDFLETTATGQSPKGTVPVDIYAALDMSLPGIVSEASIFEGGRWHSVPDPRKFTAGIGANPGPETPLA